MSSELPSYVAAARPVPQSSRAAWFKGTAPTYAGIMLWFMFWQGLAGAGGMPGGVLANGISFALIGVVLAALICHFCFYLVPGMLGMKSGLPLYIVGTSTYGVNGGFIMPGFLMGLLQFGWLGVNAFGAAELFCKCFNLNYEAPALWHGVIASVWAIGAAFMGLKGIQYVAKVATYLPLIPLAVLLVLFVKTMGGLGTFKPEQILTPAPTAVVAKTTDAAPEKAAKEEVAKAPAAVKAASPLTGIQTIIILCTVIVGFFATAGAAGTDFGMGSRHGQDVQLGGLVGIAGATIFAAGLAVLVVAGAYGAGMVSGKLAGNLNPLDLMKGGILSEGTSNLIMIALAVSSFPPACFSAFIAANSFKTTLPSVNPYVSVGLGTVVSIFLAASGFAGKVITVFVIIGASFGPICGAMMADYLLSGRKWAGPRAGFNPAGWISWAAGFLVGIDMVPVLKDYVYCPPVAAFVVGFVLYFILAKLGLESRKLSMPRA